MNLAPKQEKMTEKEYRSLRDRVSYSALKLLNDNRENFFRQLILGEVPREKQSVSITLGSMMHSLLSMIEGDFESKFHVSQIIPPSETTHMGMLIDALYTRYMQSVNEFHEQTDSFKVIFADALQRVKYDASGVQVAFKKAKDDEAILGMFEGTNNELYFKELIENAHKTTITIPMIEKAERLVQKVKEHPVTGMYANCYNGQDDGIIEVHNELPILFDIGELKCKCLPDKLIINHSEETVEPIDWKSTWMSSESIEGIYIKYRYYLQATFYNIGIREWMKEKGLEKYKLSPMSFIFCDTGGFCDPFVLKLSQDDIDRGMRGFKLRSYRYKGVSQLLQELSWHLETGIWSQSYYEAQNKSIIKLKLPYGSRE